MQLKHCCNHKISFYFLLSASDVPLAVSHNAIKNITHKVHYIYFVMMKISLNLNIFLGKSKSLFGFVSVCVCVYDINVYDNSALSLLCVLFVRSVSRTHTQTACEYLSLNGS